ncbi:rab-GTPase-TBC domain-containing protein [Irpex rosettiformis]|uniref:Rab-GTPase-TBC domain-containing protein n=1 Tax=Irpex rosettiformis TaxID=378272 RepID=A0ACB8UJ83_9APHY|nr:rab-GTPase-TBC domain-containing protein [Irpex rosettiformis]
MDSDDEHETTTHHRSSSSISRPARFNFDDAFSDTEDTADSYEFSAAAIRADLEKNLSAGLAGHNVEWSEEPDLNDLMAKIGYANGNEDGSISSLHYNPGYHDELSPPTQQPPSPETNSTSYPSEDDVRSLDEVNLASEFSSINLQSPPEPELDGSSSSLHDINQGEENNQEDEAERTIVQIDASQDHPEPTVVHVDTTPPHTPPSHTAVRSMSPPTPPYNEQISSYTASASSHSATPRSAQSVSSLQTPTSASLHTPSSAASNASTSSTATTKHKATRSVGPSILDKVISKTRPTFLPPKPKAEDLKHLADWEAMMKKSRIAEDKRRRALQDRRFARERRIEDSLVHWEREILPNWKVVYKDPKLRRLWWQGIPSKLRATMWQNAVGNSLALSKDAFKACLARASRALSSGTFPMTALDLIEDDIKTTLPSLHLFKPEIGPLYQDLKDMLCAWVVSRSDEGLGYVSGVSKVAAMILLNMGPAEGFVVMRNLLERHCLRSFYGGETSKDDVEAYYRIFDTLLADGMPKIYFNFKQHQVSPSAYLPEWLIPLFLDHLPFEACARLWDVLFLEGDAFLFRASLAILAVLEPRLFFPEKQELLELLRAENKAALDVAKRTGLVPTAKYEIYGLDEETLWERLDSMEDWWRETTWTRLISRELPDL